MEESLHILLVEDNPGDARLMNIYLQQALRPSPEIQHAQRLDEARQILSETTFEAILLDLSLPDAEGLETVKEIQGCARDTPVIVLTGRDDEDFARRAVKAGAQDFLVKDRVDESALRQAIHYALERHRALQQLRQREQFLASLHAMTQSALQGTQPEDVLGPLADPVLALFPADWCLLTLWDSNTERPIPVSSSRSAGTIAHSRPRLDDRAAITARVLESGRPLVIEDVLENPSLDAPEFEGLGADSLLGLPLIANKKRLGAILLGSHQPHRFRQEEISRGEQIAGLLALAIAKVDALQAERKRREELEILRQASLKMTSIVEIQPLIESLAEHARQLLGGSQARMFLFSDGHLREMKTRDGTVSWEQLDPTEAPLLYTAINENHPVLVCALRAHAEPSAGKGQGTLLALPLWSRQSLQGVLQISYVDSRDIDENGLRSLQLLGDQAAVALENAHLFARIRKMVVTDSLTGLFNRRGFFTLADQQMKIAGRQGVCLALLYIDLDDFKRINDTWGHLVGDRALQHFADILRTTFRESDVLARLGGDEFAVLAVDADENDGRVMRARLLKNLETANAQSGRPYRLSASVGTAGYNPESPCTLEKLVSQADRAMYSEKPQGRKERSPSI